VKVTFTKLKNMKKALFINDNLSTANIGQVRPGEKDANYFGVV
jgi:hypothetical protein